MNRFSDFVGQETNPFLEEPVVVTGQGDLLQLTEGPPASLLLSSRQSLDAQAFQKVYHDNLKAVLHLTRTAYKLLRFASQQLPAGADQVILTVAHVMAACDFRNRKSFYDSVAELLVKGVLAKSLPEDTYFVNPSIFFNGDRLQISKEYIKAPEQ